MTKTEVLFEIFRPARPGDGSFERPFRPATIVRRTERQFCQVTRGKKWDSGRRYGPGHLLFLEELIADFQWGMR